MYVCVHVYMCECVCERENARHEVVMVGSICIYVYVCIYTHDDGDASNCMCKRMYACVYVCMYACMCVCERERESEGMMMMTLETVCVNVCIHVCMYACMREREREREGMMVVVMPGPVLAYTYAHTCIHAHDDNGA